jgi:hypothetical protein
MTAGFNFLRDHAGHKSRQGRQLLPSSLVEKYVELKHEQSIEEPEPYDQSVHQVLLPHEVLHVVAVDLINQRLRKSTKRFLTGVG